MNDTKDIDKILKEMEKEYGKGAVFHGSNPKIERIPRWSVSSPNISYVLGGGVPKGRMIEISGMESAGKTSLATYLAGEIQRQGGQVLYVDYENALDLDYASSFGFDPDKAFITQPDSGEEGLDIILDFCEKGIVDYVLVDSVSAITPLAEIEGDMGDQQMGIQARLMGKALRKIGPVARKNGVTIVWLNQIRYAIGVMYGNPERVSGGQALKFWSSIRLDMRRKEYIMKGNDDYIGIVSRLKSTKNKTAPPMRKVEVELLFGQGFQYDAEYVSFAIDHDIIKKAAAWLSILDENGEEITKQQGKPSMIKYLQNNPEIFDDIKCKVNTIMGLGQSSNEEMEQSVIEKEDSEE